MKKRRFFSILLALLMLFALNPYGVYADDDTELDLFYDFEGYEADFRSGILPDEHWGTNNTSSMNKLWFGSYEENGNTALKIGSKAGSELFFDRLITSGSMHISYDFIINNPKSSVLMLFEDGNGPSGLRESGFANMNYSKTVRISSDTGKITYYFDSTKPEDKASMTRWVLTESNVSANTNEWHRFDMVTSDMSKSTVHADYYIDGQKINENPVYFANSKGFKALSFLVEPLKDASGQTYNLSSSEYLLVDNLSVTRHFNDNGLRAVIEGNGKVEMNNGELVVRLSERVDSSLLTEDNINVRGGMSDKIIENYSVEPIVNAISEDYPDDNLTDKFKINFHEELEMGTYELSLSDTVKGTSLQLPMLKPVKFRTDSKVEYLDMTFLYDKFDSYTSSQLPDGWRYQPQQTDTFHKPVTYGDEESNVCLGIENPTSSNYVRFINELENPIPPGTEYSVSFDVYTENMYWNLCLLEQNDLDENNGDFNKNIAISSKGDGLIYYAQNRTNRPRDMILVNENLFSSDATWNKVSLIVSPELNKTLYKIKINDSEQFTVETSRDFKHSATAGIGFEYMPVDNSSKLYLDNVLIESSIGVVYPEIDIIEFYDASGNKLSVGDSVTSTLSKIAVRFNTLINEESTRNAVSLLSGDDSNLEYTLDVIDYSDDTSSVELCFPNLLKEGAEYRLCINSGIESRMSDEITSLVEMTKDFYALNDACFKVIKNESVGISDERLVHNVTIVKNNESELKFSIIATAYNDVELNEESYDYSLGVKYVPVCLNSYDKGIFNYEIPIDFTDDVTKVDIMLWGWPDNNKIVLSNDSIGDIEFK